MRKVNFNLDIIGVLHGRNDEFIEIRNLSDIHDLPDGTRILTFEISPEEKMKLEQLYLDAIKQHEDKLKIDVKLSEVVEEPFASRIWKIQARNDDSNLKDIVRRKGRLRVINKRRPPEILRDKRQNFHQKIPAEAKF